MNYVRNYNRLSALSGRCLPWKFLKSYATEKTNQKLILEPLIEREIIRVKGDEVVPFLQGLMTNDIKHLHPSANKAIYAMFLNKAGRVMYDTILYSSSDPTKIFLECDKNVANDLQRHLKLYRVRRKIDIDSLNQEYNVWQAFEPHKEPKDIMYAINEDDVGDLTISVDPRLKQLGIRLLAKKNNTFAELSKLFKQHTALTSSSSNDFRFHRYNLGVAEGVVDMPPGKCFPLEANCDILNGVSFHKGCYIGQELTARVHHTGVIRKRHMPVNLTTPLPGDTTAVVKNEAGANCGTLYGSIADRALGLLRIENVIKAKKLLVNDNPCSIEIPHWWPNDLHSNILKNIRRDSKTN